MANLNECDHIITIGYLKSFIGTEIHSSGDDSRLYVNNDDDTYCPTYAELTGGTLIQNWSQGSTPNGDRDGIVVGGSYANNQCVREGDLSMKYTRFKSFSISAKKTTLSQCGDSSTLSFSHLYTRYTKSHSSDCESTNTASSEVSDTALSEVTYTSSNNVFSISKPTVSVGVNNPNGNGRANSRSTTITGSITFRNHQHTDTVGITQSALGGEYVYWTTGHTEYYSYNNLTISKSSFDCSGGNWTATGYYTKHDWNIYRWKDDCNNYYNSDTITGDDTYPTTSITVDNGSVGSIDCSTLTGNYSHTETAATWGGYNVTWTQTCKKCNCENYTAYTYTDVTASCTDLQATVNYTWTAHTVTPDSSGNCIDVPGTTGSGSYNVTWTCNTLPSDPHVTVTGAPCCSGCHTITPTEGGCNPTPNFTATPK